MGPLKVTFIAVFTVCGSLAWCVSAEEAQTTAVAGDMSSRQQEAPVHVPAQIKKPMNMDEPMQTGMMKKGMTKGDVKKSAETHAEKMKEVLKQEEESMPQTPARTSEQ